MITTDISRNIMSGLMDGTEQKLLEFAAKTSRLVQEHHQRRQKANADIGKSA